MNEQQLNEIITRLKNASTGPWKSFVEGRDHTSGSSFIMVGEDGNRKDDIELIGATHNDQDFIAAARQDIPLLIDEIFRLQGILAENKILF